MTHQAVTTRNGDRWIATAMFLTVLTLPVSVFEADWAPGGGLLPFVSLLALAAGIGLARLPRPFHHRFLHAAISAILALAVAMLHAGLLWRGLLWGLTRMQDWAAALLAGQRVDDPALVAFWASLVLWWAAYSAGHGLYSGGRALESLLPTLAILAINVIYNEQGLAYIILALFGLAVLMAWSEEGQRQGHWHRRGIDYPDDLWPDWIVVSLLAAFLISALALLLPSLTSRTTLAWVQGRFQAPAAQVRQIFGRISGGANKTFPGEAGSGANASLPTARLINSPPTLLKETVMWVHTDEPAPLPEEVPVEPVYRPPWRAVTYARYNGRGWDNPTLSPRPITSTSSMPAGQTPGLVHQEYDIVTAHGDTIYALNQPEWGERGLAALYTPEGELVGLRGTLSRYAIISRLPVMDEATLLAAPATYPPEVEPYLQVVTGTLTPRVRDLTARVTAGATTPYDKAVQIETFLRTYSYTLDLPSLPPNRDLVDYFLFDAPGGYCDYYASAMVMMLRVAGVPARLASGYARGVYDYNANAYRILAADAHSWPEVYFPGVGWVEFEPTAYRPVPNRTRAIWTGMASAGQVRAGEAQRERLTMLAWALAAVILGIGLAWIWIARRERQTLALPAGKLIPLVYERLRQRGAWLDVAIQASDTPDEFAGALCRALENYAAQARNLGWKPQTEPARQAIRQIGELYRLASYSRQPLGPPEARQAWAAWLQLRVLTWTLGWAGRAGKLLTHASRAQSIFRTGRSGYN